MSTEDIQAYIDIQTQIIEECDQRLVGADKYDAIQLLQTKGMAANGMYAATRDWQEARSQARTRDEERQSREKWDAANESIKKRSLEITAHNEQVIELLSSILNNLQDGQR